MKLSGYLLNSSLVVVTVFISIYTLCAICYHPSVCPSVRHTSGSVKNGHWL